MKRYNVFERILYVIIAFVCNTLGIYSLKELEDEKKRDG